MSAEAVAVEDRIYIKEMADELEKSVITVRSWIREDALPADLRPQREGGLQRLFWSRDQIDGMRRFSDQRTANRGWPAQR